MTHLDVLQSFALDEDGNLTIIEDTYGNQDFQLYEESEHVAQLVRIRLQTTLGEDVLHPTDGVPFNLIAAVFNEPFVVATFSRSVLDDPEVKSVDDVILEFEGLIRRLQLSVSVTAKDGTEAIATLEGPL